MPEKQRNWSSDPLQTNSRARTEILGELEEVSRACGALASVHNP